MALWKDPSVKDPAAPAEAGSARARWLYPHPPRQPAPGGGREASPCGAQPEYGQGVADRGRRHHRGQDPRAPATCASGRFKGDVNVQGNSRLSRARTSTASVNAATVIVERRRSRATSRDARVELLETASSPAT